MGFLLSNPSPIPDTVQDKEQDILHLDLVRYVLLEWRGKYMTNGHFHFVSLRQTVNFPIFRLHLGEIPTEHTVNQHKIAQLAIKVHLNC